jgi:hypothetical protein
MQLVFEIGATELQPVIEAIELAIGSVAYTLSCVPKGSEAFSPTRDTLSSAAIKLEAGEIGAFSLHPTRGLIRYALVLEPYFANRGTSLYLGTIEYTGDDYRDLWNVLLGLGGLRVVCVGFEEGVELTDEQLTPGSFPWDQWPLIIGAVRDETTSTSWTIREGPEISWFTKSS